VNLRAATSFVALLAVACAGSAARRSQPISDGRYVMGTVLEISLADVGERTAASTIAELFASAERHDALMTLYDSRSEISRLNAAAGSGPQAVDPAVAELLRQALVYTQLTHGSFDVTVGPLVQLWIDAAVAKSLPTAEALERAMALVGADGLRVLDDDRVELREAGIVVDLGGVAKGFALDRMRPTLRARGIANALLDFGQSSTLALGRPEDSAGWRLLVRGPEEVDLGVVTLSDQALSVSSSFGHWVEVGGRRYGHVIDPRSGRPLTEPRQAVIVAHDATLAEALSKALLILSPEAGLALLESQPGCEGLLVVAGGDRLRTSGWDSATRWLPGPVADGSSAGAVAPIGTP
jgi:thiamine biosynthesis lipoprotein